MSSDVSILKLKRGEDRRIRSGHLWIFSNEIDNAATPLAGFTAGARARVVSDRDQFLGHAYVNPHALICARIMGRDAAQPLDRALIEKRLKVALALRERLQTQPYYRLVFGESDQLPGLVIDRYGDVLVNGPKIRHRRHGCAEGRRGSCGADCFKSRRPVLEK